MFADPSFTVPALDNSACLSLNYLLLSQLIKNEETTELLAHKPELLYPSSLLVPFPVSSPATALGPHHQSVIKSTSSLLFNNNDRLPKCTSPTIVCQSSNKKPKKSLPHPNGSKTTTSSRRLSYAREYKLMVIEYFLTNGHNKYRTCKRFRITKSMLNGWIQKVDKIRNSRPGSLKTGHSGRKPQFPNVEEKLYELYTERRLQGYQIENSWIKEKALELARKHLTESNRSYQFSERWLNNFKRRYNIVTCKLLDATSSGLSPSESEPPSETVRADGAQNLLNALSSGGSALVPMNSVQLAEEILNTPDELPIQTFYKRFPWLCKRNLAQLAAKQPQV